MPLSEEALVLSRKAAEDEALLDAVLDSVAVSDAILGFHCQQSAEKLLKALLLTLGMEYRWTHNLYELCKRLEVGGHALPPQLLGVEKFTPFAVRVRYADDLSDEPLDRHAARALLRELRQHVERVMTNARNADA